MKCKLQRKVIAIVAVAVTLSVLGATAVVVNMQHQEQVRLEQIRLEDNQVNSLNESFNAKIDAVAINILTSIGEYEAIGLEIEEAKDELVLSDGTNYYTSLTEKLNGLIQSTKDFIKNGYVEVYTSADAYGAIESGDQATIQASLDSVSNLLNVVISDKENANVWESEEAFQAYKAELETAIADLNAKIAEIEAYIAEQEAQAQAYSGNSGYSGGSSYGGSSSGSGLNSLGVTDEEFSQLSDQERWELAVQDQYDRFGNTEQDLIDSGAKWF